MDRELQILVLLVSVIISGWIFGLIVKAIYEHKGYSEGGFLLGFFLGIIGVIIAAAKPDNHGTYSYSATDDYVNRMRGWDQKAKNTNKTVSDTIVTLSNGDWKCPNCQRINARYVGTCGCGLSKAAFEASKVPSEPVKTPVPITETVSKKQTDAIQQIKEYKELLDIGAITQEEYDAKKKQLLEL